MPGKDVIPVDEALQDLLLDMTPQDVTLLVLKILYPDKPLYELAKDVWHGVGGASRRRRIHASRVNMVVRNIVDRPYLLAMILTSKLMPLAIATLYEGLSADKENVRVSAAKELIRFAQTTANKLVKDDAPLATDALDNLVDDAIEGECTVIEEDEDEADPTGD